MSLELCINKIDGEFLSIYEIGDADFHNSLFSAYGFPSHWTGPLDPLKSVGVANVLEYLPDLQETPNYITRKKCGAGFTELADVLLAAQRT